MNEITFWRPIPAILQAGEWEYGQFEKNCEKQTMVLNDYHGHIGIEIVHKPDSWRVRIFSKTHYVDVDFYYHPDFDDEEEVEKRIVSTIRNWNTILQAVREAQK